MSDTAALPRTMRAMQLARLGPVTRDSEPLRDVRLPLPRAGAGEVLIAVSVCGVCHTELDEIEGRTPPPRLPVVPGHEAIGRVVGNGPGAGLHRNGARVGVGWIHSSSGADDENLSPQFCATGRDANGGYAQYMTVPERYAIAIPEQFGDAQAAPLLCAGAVGYRALRLCALRDGERLGLVGFGGSAHLVLQLARYLYPASETAVFARDSGERAFARELGATWAGDIGAPPPALLHAIIDTTPVWRPVLAALEVLRPGGRLVINAIRKEDGDRDCLAQMSYARHLWQEKELKTVANVTREDIAQFLPLAAAAGIRPAVRMYALADANAALRELKFGGVRGAKVLRIAD